MSRNEATEKKKSLGAFNCYVSTLGEWDLTKNLIKICGCLGVDGESRGKMLKLLL